MENMRTFPEPSPIHDITLYDFVTQTELESAVNTKEDKLSTIATFDDSKQQVLLNNIGDIIWVEGSTFDELLDTKFGSG